MRSSPYLERRSTKYWFRLSVPKDLRVVFGRTQIRLSLRTSDYQQAKIRSSILSGKVLELYARARGGEIVTREELEAVIYDCMKDFVAKLSDVSELTLQLKKMQFLKHQDAISDSFVTELEEKESLELSREERDLACKIAREAILQSIQVLQARKEHNFEYEHKVFDKAKPVEKKGPRLFEIIDLYIQENNGPNGWKPRTAKSFLDNLELFKSIVGNVYMSDINHDTLIGFKNSLCRLPKNKGKLKEYRDKSVPELLLMDIPEDKRMSVTTINGHLTNIGTFFNWCKGQGYAEVNYAEGKKLKNKTQTERDTFTKEDLELIFSQDFKKDFQYWIPVIGLHTGARINEIAQLYKNDIVKQDGIYCFRIDQANEGQSIKKDSTARIIPIHPKIIELGFLRYVESVKGERIFPELIYQNNSFGHGPTKWFSYLKRKIGFGKDKVFHSFRHTLVNHCLSNNCNDHLLKQYIGHKEKDITSGIYNRKGYSVKQINEELIPLIKFDIDLSHLKGRY